MADGDAASAATTRGAAPSAGPAAAAARPRLRAVPRHRRHAARARRRRPTRVRVDADVARAAARARARARRRARADHRPRDRRRRPPVPGLALPIAGQHGCERRGADGAIHRHRPPHAGLARLRRELARFAAAPRRAAARGQGRDARAALPAGAAPRGARASDAARAGGDGARAAAAWRLQPGKGMVEVRPDGRDKGTAIARVHGRAAVSRARCRCSSATTCTDEYGFAAVDAPGRLGGQGRRRADARALPAARRRRGAPLARRRRRRRAAARTRRRPLMRTPRPRADRQRRASACWSIATGADRLGLLSALRRRRRRSARCSTTRRPAPSAASSRSSSSTARAPSRRTSTNTAVLVTRLFDDAGRRGRDHRLRAALPAARPRVPPDDARPPRAPARRQPAHRRPPAARPSTMAATRPAITVGSNHIRYVTPDVDAAAHDRCVAHRDPRGAAVLPRATPSRCCSGPTRRCRAPSPRSAAASSRKRSPTGATGCAGSRFRSNGRTR